ncbi:MAG: SH3 domain-containing protein [Pseudotabrizicola sp.]|uniref:SH3 domain-containing protein n=1 Tax=Pseudotabrizicola sp. TaxID=2939647 RepID=UPI00271C36EA|nr:SH3 domain-containing protein [Pseudotabrizicola sp.]MDO9640244.1 SH3 domain-containing protein [Pseudotabrizicola sp.]
MLKALVTGIALSLGAGPVLADVVRPRPNPVLAPAGAEAEPLTATPVSASAAPAAATEVRPVMRPLGPPAPAAVVAVPRDPNKGAVTNLPLPRYVSLKTNEGYARRGPGLSHRIDWVFTRVGMPLKVTAEHGHWRRVEDAEGMGGWMHYALVSGVRSVMVNEEMATFFSRPDTASLAAFQAERGVVTRLIACKDGWCRVTVDGQKGWAPVSSLWGVTADEVID